MQSIVNFFLFSNFFISLCAAAATWQFYIVTGTKTQWMYVCFVFCSTFVFYNLQRLFLSKNYVNQHFSERHAWIVVNKKLLYFFVAVAFLLALPLVSFWTLNSIIVFAVFSLLAALYFLPYFNFRSVVLLKASYISVLWMFSTFVFPALLHNQYNAQWLSVFSNSYFLAMAAERFFFVLPLCVIFNIRDMEVDKIAGVKTIPILFGIKAAKIFSVLLLALYTLVLYYQCFHLGFVAKYGQLMQVYFFPQLLSVFTTAAVIMFANSKRGEVYYLFAVDGMILLQALLCAISTI